MKHRPAHARAGFTLAEVAVTLLIVSFGLLLVSQGLSNAKMLAAETHYRKVARELGLVTLGQVESGLFWEELDGGGDSLTGSYAEEGYEDFSYELVVGDEDFRDSTSDYDPEDYHDSWESERERRERLDGDSNDDEDEEEVAQPYEKVRLKVSYPHFGEEPRDIVLERWIPWDQVYGADEEGSSSSSTPSE